MLRRNISLLWKKYFRDPSQWLDNRGSKSNPEFPDFKHKITGESLWIDNFYNPLWIHEELRKPEKTLTERQLLQDNAGLVALLKTCAKNKDLHTGIKVHAEILERDLIERDPFLASALVCMYAKCGALVKAQEVLDELPTRDVFTWSALISGYAQGENGEQALISLKRMQLEGLFPDSVTYACILKACGSIGALEEGERVHLEIVRKALLKGDIVLGGALVDMYTKCGALGKAKEVLEGLPVRNVLVWNALIAGYAQEEHAEEALDCLEKMECEGLQPNTVTYVCCLKACGSLGALYKGNSIHSEIVRQGLLKGDVVLGGALVDMYAKCGALMKAKEVLEGLSARDVVTWSALIAGYMQENNGKEALNCFEKMQDEGLSPDAVTFGYILKACGSIRALEKGENIHSEIVKQQLLGKSPLLGGALVDMYVKCGVISKAKEVLEGLAVRDPVTWCALIAGYAQEEHAKEAVNCFEEMQRDGLCPDAVTCIWILKACGSIGALDKGEHIHSVIVKQGMLERDLVLGGALVDMYAKCGALIRAKEVLDGLPVRGVVPWSSVIAGYAKGEHADEVLISFEQMQQEGLYPDNVCFLCVLAACSHLGLLDEGHKYFMQMNRDHRIVPGLEHYACMIDLLGRAGLLDKAASVIGKVHSSNPPSVWIPLLTACKKWGNMKLGMWAFEHATQSDVITPPSVDEIDGCM